jgi:hypothetical protein
MEGLKRAQGLERDLRTIRETLEATVRAHETCQEAELALRALTEVRLDHTKFLKKHESEPKTTYLIEPLEGSGYIPEVITRRRFLIPETDPERQDQGYVYAEDNVEGRSRRPTSTVQPFIAEFCAIDSKSDNCINGDDVVVFTAASEKITLEEDETYQWKEWRAENGQRESIKHRRESLRDDRLEDEVEYIVKIPVSQIGNIKIREIRGEEVVSEWPPVERAAEIPGLATA